MRSRLADLDLRSPARARASVRALALPPTRVRAAVIEVHKLKPNVSPTFVVGLLAGGRADPGAAANGRELVTFAADAKPDQRAAVIAGFRAAKLDLPFVHEVAKQTPAKQRVLVADFLAAGGSVSTIFEWIHMGLKALDQPRVRRRAPLVRRRAKARGLFDWLGDAVDWLTGAINSLVDAVVSAGKSLAQAIAEAASWTVGEIKNLIKALIDAGKSVGQLLSAAVANGVAVLKKYVRAMVELGKSVGDMLLWGASQIASTVRTLVDELLKAGIALARVVTDAVARGLSAVRSTVKALIELGKSVADILGPVVAAALASVKLVVDGLLAAGVAMRSALVAALTKGATLVKNVVTSMIQLGRTVGQILMSVASDVFATVKGVVKALLDAARTIREILNGVATALAGFVRNVVLALLELGRTLAAIMVELTLATFAALKAGMRALLELGRTLAEIFATIQNRAISILRTVLDATLQIGQNLATAALAIVRNVAEGFRRGFFEGLIQLGLAPLDVLKALASAGAAVVMLGAAVFLEIWGGHRPLSAAERREAERVFGVSIDLDRVKIANASIPADIINYLNGGRTFTTMYVINFSSSDTPATNPNFMKTLIHELTHVWQGIQVGPIYMVEALEAQFIGAGYDYTEQQLLDAKGNFDAFNREQQASIIEDYWDRRFNLTPARDTTAWAPYAARVYRAKKPSIQDIVIRPDIDVLSPVRRGTAAHRRRRLSAA